eukprot:354865-Chlamydomonas_euryale.AAC.3
MPMLPCCRPVEAAARVLPHDHDPHARLATFNGKHVFMGSIGEVKLVPQYCASRAAAGRVWLRRAAECITAELWILAQGAIKRVQRTRRHPHSMTTVFVSGCYA